MKHMGSRHQHGQVFALLSKTGLYDVKSKASDFERVIHHIVQRVCGAKIGWKRTWNNENVCKAVLDLRPDLSPKGGTFTPRMPSEDGIVSRADSLLRDRVRALFSRANGGFRKYTVAEVLTTLDQVDLLGRAPVDARPARDRGERVRANAEDSGENPALQEPQKQSKKFRGVRGRVC